MEELATIQLSPTRLVAVARANEGYIWLNEKIDSPDYRGYTHKGFGVKISDVDDLIDAVRDVASASEPREHRFVVGKGKELVVYRPGNGQVDIRHFIDTEKYTGFSKKGIRLMTANAIKISDGLGELLRSGVLAEADDGSAIVDTWAKYDDQCKSCGTTRRPHFRDGLCSACYEHENRIDNEAAIDLGTGQLALEVAQRADAGLLESAYAIHSKKCYVCNNGPSKVGPLELYFADGDTKNTSEENMYPICGKCKSLI